ncbi:MAG TPA: YqgE/AlgH family protein [Gammaproteobacteria bacterium]|nr:YqgE/AlgH family protein [Gammaproteobacteria bacterium]
MLNISAFSKLILSIPLLLFVTGTCLAETSNNNTQSNLKKGVFLVASDKIKHGALGKTVIYITQHDAAGTSGFIVNRPTNLLINQAFPEIHASKVTNKTLFFGGPLHSQYLFMLTKTQFTHGLYAVKQGIYFGAGEEVKMRLRSNNKRDKIRTYAGFMSWGPGQVANEITNGDWVVAPASLEQLFIDDTSNLWRELYHRWAGSWI